MENKIITNSIKGNQSVISNEPVFCVVSDEIIADRVERFKYQEHPKKRKIRRWLTPSTFLLLMVFWGCFGAYVSYAVIYRIWR